MARLPAQIADIEGFENALDTLIEEGTANGIPSSAMVACFAHHVADIERIRAMGRVDVFIKVFIVLFCTFIPAAIHGIKVYAVFTGQPPPPDDPWIKAVCLVSLLSVVAQFYDVERIIRLLRKKQS